MNIAHPTDDQLRRELFERVVDRLQAEAKKDPAILVQNRTPVVFSLSRHGNLLTVYQAEGARLLRGELQWKYTPDEDAPWTFTVFRAVDRSQLRLEPNGPEATIDTIVDNIVTTFLTQTELGTA